MYASESDCTSDATNAAWRNCTSLESSRDGTVWWRSEGDITAMEIMISGGSTVWEFGPADLVLLGAAYQTLGANVGTPNNIAPADWTYTIPGS